LWIASPSRIILRLLEVGRLLLRRKGGRFKKDGIYRTKVVVMKDTCRVGRLV
jgi:hypothetical protein